MKRVRQTLIRRAGKAQKVLSRITARGIVLRGNVAAWGDRTGFRHRTRSIAQDLADLGFGPEIIISSRLDSAILPGGKAAVAASEPLHDVTHYTVGARLPQGIRVALGRIEQCQQHAGLIYQ